MRLLLPWLMDIIGRPLKRMEHISSSMMPSARIILTVDTNAIKKANWQVLLPHQENVIFDNFKIFDNYLVIRERAQAENRIKIINRTTQAAHYIRFKEDYHTAYIGYNPDTNTDSLQVFYTCLLYTSPSPRDATLSRMPSSA